MKPMFHEQYEQFKVGSNYVDVKFTICFSSNQKTFLIVQFSLQLEFATRVADTFFEINTSCIFVSSIFSSLKILLFEIVLFRSP